MFRQWATACRVRAGWVASAQVQLATQREQSTILHRTERYQSQAWLLLHVPWLHIDIARATTQVEIQEPQPPGGSQAGQASKSTRSLLAAGRAHRHGASRSRPIGRAPAQRMQQHLTQGSVEASGNARACVGAGAGAAVLAGRDTGGRAARLARPAALAGAGVRRGAAAVAARSHDRMARTIAVNDTTER